MSRWSLVEALREASPVQAVLRVAWPPVWEIAQRLDGLVRRVGTPTPTPASPPSSIHVDAAPAASSEDVPEVFARSLGSVYLVTMRYRGTIRATWCCARTHRRLATRTLSRA